MSQQNYLCKAVLDFQVEEMDRVNSIVSSGSPHSGPTRERAIWKLMPHEIPAIVEAFKSAKRTKAGGIYHEEKRRLFRELYLGWVTISELEALILADEKRARASR